MADYNRQSGFTGEEERRPVSTYNAHQDEFGFKEGDDYGDRQQGLGDQGQAGEDGTGETFQDAPDRMTDTGGDGLKSGYDRATHEQTQFGLEGKTGYGHEGSDPQLGQTDTRSAADPHASSFENTPKSNTESVPAGDGWGAEDTSRTHGAKKDGLVNKIKEKLPGQHHTATGVEDPTAPPKKGVMEKIKEKLPGHHGSGSVE